jgi:hypothetical protein
MKDKDEYVRIAPGAPVPAAASLMYVGASVMTGGDATGFAQGKVVGANIASNCGDAIRITRFSA